MSVISSYLNIWWWNGKRWEKIDVYFFSGNDCFRWKAYEVRLTCQLIARTHTHTLSPGFAIIWIDITLSKGGNFLFRKQTNEREIIAFNGEQNITVFDIKK